MVCWSSSGVGCYGGGHPCIILHVHVCPGHGSDGRRGGRDCHGEKKRQVRRSLKHARLRSSSYGDLRSEPSDQRHRPKLSARPRSQANYVNRRHTRDLFLATTPLLYCMVLYLYIYIALLEVHTNQKRFQCERPREKRAVLRERKEGLGSPVNKVDRVEGRSWFQSEGPMIAKTRGTERS